MTITRITPSLIRVTPDTTENDGDLLGINTFVLSGGFPAQRVSAASRKGAVLVHDGERHPWPVSRVLTYEGQMYLCGPRQNGTTIEEFLNAHLPEEQRQAGLAAIVKATAHILEDGSHLLCNTGTTLLTEDGAVLLLNEGLCAEINRYLPTERRQNLLFPYRVSRFTEPAQSIYQCGTILWHGLTGTPFCSAPDEIAANECHEGLRTNPQIHRIEPRIPRNIVTSVETLLADPGSSTAGRLRALATNIETEGIADVITADEIEARRSQAEERFQREHRSYERRTFIRRNGTKIALITAVVVVVGLIPLQIIRERLRPPETAGLGVRELVATYYEAWSTLDHVVMDEALARGVGEDIVKEVTNAYVIDRVQFAHSMKQKLVPADEWLTGAFNADVLPYGPVIKEMTVVRSSDTEALVVVDYDLWRPIPPENEEEGAAVHKSTRRDNLTLTPTKWGWEISSIETVILEAPESIPLNRQSD